MTTEAQKRAHKAYMQKRRRVPIYMTPEQYELLKAAAGESMNAYILEAIEMRIRKEGKL